MSGSNCCSLCWLDLHLIRYSTPKNWICILSSENAAPQLLTATEKSAKLALKWSNEWISLPVRTFNQAMYVQGTTTQVSKSLVIQYYAHRLSRMNDPIWCARVAWMQGWTSPLGEQMNWKEHSSRFSSDAWWSLTIQFQDRLGHCTPFV